MSDFLTRATEVAMGRRRVVQPLVASRYAPGPHQPLREMETMIDQPPAVDLAGAVSLNEVADRPRDIGLNDSSGVYEQSSEKEARPDDRAAWPETRVMNDTTTLPAQSVTKPRDGAAEKEASPDDRAAWPETRVMNRVAAQVVTKPQDAAASARQPEEYSAAATTEQQEVFISESAEDRVLPNQKISIRPKALIVSESDGEPQNLRTRAPLSVPLVSSEPAETPTSAAARTRAGRPEGSEPPSSPAPATTRNSALHDHLIEDRREVLLERRLDVPIFEAVRNGDLVAQRPLSQFNEAAIVTTKGNDVDRTEPGGRLDQSLFNRRDDRSSPDNSGRQLLANQRVSESATISDRGATEPPTIRVTIGRIEVRAETPPAPPVETIAPPRPKMSLAEYLRQHNGRKS